MPPTFSPCCGSPRIADTGCTIAAIVDELAGDVLASQTASVYRCAECGGTFAALLDPAITLTDEDFVYTRRPPLAA
jgi:hypothetical protein